jgi:YihY family inner membrane protein
MVLALSRFVGQQAILATIAVYLGRLVPGQSVAILAELQRSASQTGTFGWVFGGTLVFFSSLAFSVLEKSLSVIFQHRLERESRNFLVSALLPYCYVVLLVFGMLAMTLVSEYLLAIGAEHVDVLGHTWPLKGVSGALLYLMGVVAEIILLTSLYAFTPAGTATWRHALVGGCTATVLWEIIRHVLIWYFRTRTQVGLIYGSLTSTVLILTSFEIFAILILLGAQVIAEYERVGAEQDLRPLAPVDRSHP